MAERCGLLVIIALGESLLLTGATFSGLEWTAARTTALVAAFGASVALWWVYFDRTAELGSERIAHSEDAGAIARLAYTYIHIPIVAGIIITAVGDEVVLAHPTERLDGAELAAVVGGPALYLIGHVALRLAHDRNAQRQPARWQLWPVSVVRTGLLRRLRAGSRP